MNKKPRFQARNTTRPAGGDAAIGAVNLGSGVTVFSPRGAGVTLPENVRRIPLHVHSDIRDLKEGRAETVSIWGVVANMDYVSEQLTNESVRESVTDFFLGRRIGPVIERMVPTAYFRPEEATFSKSEYYDALCGSGCDDSTAQVIMELTTGVLCKIGVLSSNGDRAKQVVYPFRRVTTSVIAHEVNMQQIESALAGLNLTALDGKKRQTKRTFAERLSDIFRAIGVKMLEITELRSIVDDIIRCVRAHIAPRGFSSVDKDGIPSTWREHATVGEFATCLPFVRAAMQLDPTEPLKLKNESRVLESWLKIVINYLRDSTRFKWLNRESMLRHHTTRHVRDMRGQIQSVVVYRAVKAVATAQAVLAIPDAATSSAGGVFVTATKDRLADTIHAAYSRAPFSTEEGALTYLETVRDLIGVGYRGSPDAILVDAVGDGSTIADIAVLLSTSLEVEVDERGVVVESEDSSREGRSSGNRAAWDPKWWFSVATVEANLDITSGRHYGDRVVTCDPVEVLKAHAEITAVEPYPAQPQQLGPNAFLSTLLGFDDSNLIGLDDKFKFKVAFAGKTVEGAFAGSNFAALRSSRLAKVVRPTFNRAVIEAESSAYSAAMNAMIEAGTHDKTMWTSGQSPTSEVLNSVKRRVCVRLLKLAQGLSPAFRDEVQGAIIDRALSVDDLTTEDMVVMRATLLQGGFTAVADIVSLLFFMHLQGISVPGWTEIATSDLMASVCLDYGSDRKPRE